MLHNWKFRTKENMRCVTFRSNGWNQTREFCACCSSKWVYCVYHQMILWYIMYCNHEKNMLPIDPKFNEIWWFQWGCMNCWKPSEAILVHFRGYGSHFWAYHVDHTQTAGFCCAWAVEGWDALGEFCHAGSGDRNCWWTCLSRDIHAQDCTSTYSTIINS